MLKHVAKTQKAKPTNKKVAKKVAKKSVKKVQKRNFSAKPAAGITQTEWTTKTDEEVVDAMKSNKIRFFNIENSIGDVNRAVAIRRKYLEQQIGKPGVLDKLPHQNYDFNEVFGQCCENVIGVVPIPVGVAGPLTIDGEQHYLPMATTEGALVASTSRGCKALDLAGGVTTNILQDKMNRGPVLSMPTATECAKVAQWVHDNIDELKGVFNSTSRFARLQEIRPIVAGRNLFLKFRATTGDGMGMNMVGKGTDKTIKHMLEIFPTLKLVALSGNTCTDKKPAAVNWIEGRGKSVVAEAIIPRKIVEDTFKTTPEAMVEVHIAKNLVGSAIAGTMGGNNAHAANVVAAMFLALGQDPAQVVESANCMTTIEMNANGDLYTAVTMPSLEVGAIGGGTILSPQGASLELLGVRGSHPTNPGQNAKRLAQIISSGVLAGELSLLAALSANHLISAHLALNRKPAAPTEAPADTKH